MAAGLEAALAIQERCEGNWEMGKVANLMTFRGKSLTVLGDCTRTSWGQKRGRTECSLSHGSSEASVSHPPGRCSREADLETTGAGQVGGLVEEGLWNEQKTALRNTDVTRRRGGR